MNFQKRNQTNLKPKKIITVLFVLSLLIFLPRCPPDGPIGTVDRQTEQGTVTGEHYAHNGYESFRFRGIPYAQPPVGDLRFRPPVDPDPYPDGKLEAFNFTETCIQGASDTADPFGREDCLYLNIWTPPGVDVDSKKPVMFWIHGGGNAWGSADEVLGDVLDLIIPPEWEDSLLGFLTGLGFTFEDSEVYDGHYLAGGKDVVIVTIDYRLGPLGHLAHPALGEGSGNFTFLDIRQALSWVQTNIENFGGDKENVTVFGESAGAWNTCALMNMPTAKGMFHKAIMQSMSCLSKTPAQAEEMGDFFIQRTGCQNATDIASCLRQVDATTFYDISKDIAPNKSRNSYIPVVDGTIFPEWFADALETDSFSHVPLIYGHTKDEFILPNLSNDIINCTMNKNLEIFAEHLDAPLYRFRFDHHAYSTLFPVYHSSELPYVFATVADLYNNSPREVAVAEVVTTYWTNFAHTGNPNGGGLDHWPAYNQQSESFMSLKENPTVKSGAMIQFPTGCETSRATTLDSFGDMIFFW